MKSLLLLLSLSLVSPAKAGESAAFLKIVPAARPIGMGGAFTAVSDDLSALHFNPGGLAQLGQRQASLTHAQLFADTSYDFLGFAQPLPSLGGTAAFGAARLGYGSISGRDENRQDTGGFAAADTVVQAAFGRGIGESMFGLCAKYIESAIGNASARTYAVDLGVMRPLPTPVPVTAGLSINNIGPGMRYLSETGALPTSVSAGVSTRLAALRVSADFKLKAQGGGEFGLGTEYAVLAAFAMRAGYSAAAASVAAAPAGGALSPGIQGLGVGFGLRLGRAAVDYSFVPQGELGSSQRISISSRF